VAQANPASLEKPPELKRFGGFFYYAFRHDF